MNWNKISQYLMAATVIFTVAACSEDDGYVVEDLPSIDSSESIQGDVVHRLEVPRLKDGTEFLVHWAKTKDGRKVMNFCLEYEPSKYHSRWVAYRFDRTTSAKNVDRKDHQIRPQYPKDPLLHSFYIENDRSFNGYQHGHLCASEDRVYSREANDQTFYMSNMSPQIGDFNGGYWSTLEMLVRNLGRKSSVADTLYVVKGGTIAEGQYSKRVANNRIVVPKYYFMALLKVKNKVYSSIGFWMEHKKYGSYEYGNFAPIEEMSKHAVSIDRLEELTGIDFFHNLPDKVENAVESSYIPSAWGL